MATPDLPTMNPGGEMTHNIPPRREVSPFADFWFTQSTVTGIDREMMGWMVAQGWQVTNVSYDSTTTPPTPSYSMSRQGMNNWFILQDLMNSLTSAFNDGRTMNYLRYRDIVTIWNHAFAESQQQFQQMTAKSNADVVVYFSQFNNDLAAISAEIGLARSEALAEADRVATQLDAYLAKLSDIEANYQAHAAKIATLITQQNDALATYLSDYSAKLGTLDSEYQTHLGQLDAVISGMSANVSSHVAAQLAAADQLLSDYNTHANAVGVLETDTQSLLTAHSSQVESTLGTILSDYGALASSINGLIADMNTAFDDHATTYDDLLTQLSTDFTAHSGTATAFLTGLGVTELARINEAFDARLSVVAQALVDRGFYSAAILNDQQDRVERERNQAIVELNDRLAREKLANEHQLFEQQDRMRSRTMDGKGRLYGIQQDLLRYEAQSAHQLFGDLQSVRDRTLQARQIVYGLKEGFNSYQIEVANNLQSQLQSVRNRTMDNRDRLQAIRDALSRVNLENTSHVYTELAAIRRQGIESTVQTHAAKQDIYGNQESQRDKLLAQLNDAVNSVLDGRQKYSAMSLQKGQYLSDLRVKLNVQLMEMAVRKLQMLQGTSQYELDLMKYQLDNRNNFLIGMFRVIQDRSDEYPDLTEISKLAFSLGDAGSGWVAP